MKFFIPQSYKSQDEILAAIDVENLLTNFPVHETIDIILNDIYHHSFLLPKKINSTMLKKTTFYYTSTTQAPFYDHLGDINIQTDGISMGSPHSPLFSYLCMANLENRICNKMNKSTIYARYIDDIFIQTVTS